MTVSLIFFFTVKKYVVRYLVILGCVALLLDENTCACKMREIRGSVSSVDED
jgi:hypothetical protein